MAAVAASEVFTVRFLMVVLKPWVFTNSRFVPATASSLSASSLTAAKA
jgi:hypothetical protein